MVSNQAVLKLFDPPTRHHRVFFAPVFVSVRFSFLWFARGDNGRGQIGRPHTVVAYCGIQEIILVGRLSLLTERECGRSDDIIDDANS